MRLIVTVYMVLYTWCPLTQRQRRFHTIAVDFDQIVVSRYYKMFI